MSFPKRTPKTLKYANVCSTCKYGHSHRSKLEGAVCNIIWFREKAGELYLLQVEDHIKLSGWYLYIADFKCRNVKTGEIFWIESKGYADHRWPSTKKGWKYAGPGILEVWGGTWRRPTLLETIVGGE